jgi:hypothetical protein
VAICLYPLSGDFQITYQGSLQIPLQNTDTDTDPGDSLMEVKYSIMHGRILHSKYMRFTYIDNADSV